MIKQSIANKIMNVRQQLDADKITISLTSAKLKYSIEKAIMQYIPIIETRYLQYVPTPREDIDGTRLLVLSSLCTYAKNIGRLNAASKVVAREFTPRVSEHISIQSPKRKARVNRNPFPISIGRRMMKYINTIGTATLNKAM